ncbi:uncharacterized protein EKO05_0009306 [Ascochyta rabiei]|uniref:uncharacterized protein n=1 Tax=Didymella rabiei TaxID=5454 RepID=UPI0018FFD812|nr:uncharacterized protein EKO05_0009306 [Ascochyta rabiei]UPX19029.1 hypothetical protein EKO05_0009306 [Ascochyta rabiei]
MLFSRLFTLVVLALTSPAFLILEGQEEGIYAVKYIDGRSVHTNIANATVYRHFPESYFKPEASRNSRSRRNHNRSICGGAKNLDYGNTNAAMQTSTDSVEMDHVLALA